MIVIQQDPLLAVRLLEDLVFGSKVVDHLLLLAMDPTGQHDDIELPRMKYEIHDRSVGVKCVEIGFTIRCSARRFNGLG